MNILILGAGEIGYYLAEQLSSQEHNICIIEEDARVAAEVRDKLDARVVEGNGSAVSVLEEAGVTETDVFLGLSSLDNTNLVAASLARTLGAKRSIARVHSDNHRDQWMFDFRKHFGIDYLFSSERLAAVEMAKHIRNPDCLIVEEVARGRIEIQQVVATAGSAAVGRTPREMSLPPRVRLGSILRGEKAIVPRGDETIQCGDVVTLFGSPRTLLKVAELFRGPLDREMKVVIFGGGEYGLALAQMLDSGRFRTRIFETDPRRCAHLASVLQHAVVIQADGTSQRQLREEQVGEADFFVGATGADEDNVMACLQAHDLGVKRCVSLVHRADYADVILRAGGELGIVGAVSPRVATSRDLMRFFITDELTTLVRLPGGIEVVEFSIPERSALAGRQVREIAWPPGAGIVALTHGAQASVPVGDDLLQAGDSVVALVATEALRAFRKLLH